MPAHQLTAHVRVTVMKVVGVGSADLANSGMSLSAGVLVIGPELDGFVRMADSCPMASSGIVLVQVGSIGRLPSPRQAVTTSVLLLYKCQHRKNVIAQQ